jgi:hypothetical protein
MGKWLAEFQENTPETHRGLTDKTDKNLLMSVMAAQAQGHLGGKTEISDNSGIPQFKYGQDVQAEKLIEAACRDLEITPVQFRSICSEKELKDISNGSTPLEELRMYAASFADGIRTGRIIIHPTTQELIRHITDYQWSREGLLE